MINYNYQSEKTKLGFIDFDASFVSLTRRLGADSRKISLQPSAAYPLLLFSLELTAGCLLLYVAPYKIRGLEHNI